MAHTLTKTKTQFKEFTHRCVPSCAYSVLEYQLFGFKLSILVILMCKQRPVLSTNINPLNIRKY